MYDSSKIENVQENYFPLFDIAKLGCAFLVVLIHCAEVQYGHPVAMFVVKCFSGQAVPFFMITSGFLVAGKIDRATSLKKIVGLCFKNWLFNYCIWSLLWLPYYVVLYRAKYPDESFSYRFIMIVRRIVFAGQGVYWYLLVLAEAVFIVWFFVHYRKEKILYCLGVIGFILGILYDANVMSMGMDMMHNWIYIIFSWSNNVFMKGIPYVAWGYFLKKRIGQLHIEVWKPVVAYFVASICMVLLYITGKEQWLCLYPIQAGGLFLIACRPIRGEIKKTFYRACRNMSSAIYFLHTVFIYGIIDPFFGVDSLIILKFSISVMLSVLVMYVVKKMKIYPIKWLLCIR